MTGEVHNRKLAAILVNCSSLLGMLTSQIGAGCHRPLLNAVQVRKEFVPRIAAWKGRIWHRLAEEFT
jgi:hypothetical protein